MSQSITFILLEVKCTFQVKDNVSRACQCFHKKYTHLDNITKINNLNYLYLILIRLIDCAKYNLYNLLKHMIKIAIIVALCCWASMGLRMHELPNNYYTNIDV